MRDLMAKKDYNLTEITWLLLQMRDNCVPKDGEMYNDPERQEKYEALQAAADLINNPSLLVDAEPVITGETSDGYHTFNELYHHRAVLFSVIIKAFSGKAWKAKKHEDGSMYDGMFIVGVETPDGQATYHYDIDPYWEMFECRELEYAPKWDGHTPQEAIERIGKLEPVRYGKWVMDTNPNSWYFGTVSCSECSSTNYCGITPYCPNCGAKMDGEKG